MTEPPPAVEIICPGCGGDWTVEPPTTIVCECGMTLEIIDATTLLAHPPAPRRGVEPELPTAPPRAIGDLLRQVWP